jgi:hypothetical protein
MAKAKKKSEEADQSGNDTGSEDAAGNFNAAAAENAGSAEEKDPTVLTDTTDASLEKTFNAIVAQSRDELAPYKPAIAKLSQLVSRLDLLCDGQVGVEVATLDTLRKYNLNRGGSPLPPYCILNIYDARLLVRVNEENGIDCYRGNINKAQAQIQQLDDNDFWYQSGTPNFFRYNLDSAEDCTVFLNSVLRIAAMRKASQELSDLDVKPKPVSPAIGKSRDIKS